MFSFNFQINKRESIIADSSFLIFDGNLSATTIDTLVDICKQNKVTSKCILPVTPAF